EGVQVELEIERRRRAHVSSLFQALRTTPAQRRLESAAEDELLQRVDDLRVELRAGDARALGERLVTPERRWPDARHRHRVPRLGGGEDAGALRDRVAREPVGIPAPVDALVVAAHPRRLLVVERLGGEPGADRGVLLELAPLPGVREPWPDEQLGRRRDL